MTTAPKVENVRLLIEKLRYVRGVGVHPAEAEAIHPSRFRQLAREGRASPPHLLARYTPARQRATLVAFLLEHEARLTDAVLEMSDRGLLF